MSEQKVRIEEIKVRGTKVIQKIKAVVRAGNMRRLIIKNKQGKALVDLPLTVGVVGAILAPQVAVLGAIVALLIDGSIVVEKLEAAAEEPVVDLFEI
jgi:hypothetical protein